MANYLGKISAIVSANTAGYVRGLNEAAAQTRNFAKTVQSDINRASRDADRSLKSILTPLQQFQRSLNAAVSQRLAFKGVDGIVTGIGQLQTKLRELQRQGSSTVDVALNISGRESVDKLIEDLDVLDGKTVQAVIQAVNAESISRAKAQLEQLFSVANEIAKPLSAAVKQFERLGLGVQASFTPALNVAQKAVQELEATIREGGQVGQDEFDRVARVVDRTTASIRRLSEASAAVDALPTGQEFQFQDPRLAQRLQAASRAATDAAALPAETIESAGVARLVSQLRQASDFALQTQTRLENARAQGLTEDTARISGQLNTAGQTVDKITRVLQASGQLNILSDDDLQRSRDSGLAESLERDRRAAEEVAEALGSLRDRAAFTITGRVQNFEQVRQQLSQIVSQIGELDAATTAGFDLDIGTLNRIVSEEDLRDLPTAQAIIDRITSALGQRRSLDIETETAQREAEQLAATIDRLRANADFAITGRPQNLDQVQSELQRILGTIDRLNDQQRGELRVSAVIDAINAGDLQQAQQALADLKQQAEAGARFNLDAEEAQRAATDLQNRLAGIRERVEFTITGRVQNFDQARQELNSLLGDVSRLDQAARSAFSQRLQTAGEIIESGEVSKLEQAAAILQQVRAEVAGIGQAPVKDPLGPALDDPIRQVDVLKGGINSLQGQLDNLPAPIRQRFLPELRRLRDQFTQAEKSPQRFGQELENAADDVRRLSAEVRRIGQAQGLGSFADSLDDTALRGALGNLQALQQILNRVGATAGSDGAKQFDRLRDAIQRATNAGTIGSEEFQRELEQITQEAAAAAAATGRIGKSAAFREIKRGGDIARGGFDKFSLAAQQAAFAIDDFFSATGDFSQKVRAVQNNVTQLAFLVGGTKGLFIGLGVAIAAQATVALIKWAQGSVEAEDKTQALNDALARQKSLVEELKQAFDSLGDSLTRGIFDGATERARDFDRQIEDIRRKAAEVRQEQAASLDAGVNEQRALQVSLRNDLENETDAGSRVGLERRIEASREEERRLARQAANRRVDAGDVVDQVVRSLEEQLRGRASDIRFATGFAASLGARGGFANAANTSREAAERAVEPLRQQTQQRIDDLRRVGGNADVLQLEDILEDRISELVDRTTQLQSPGLTSTPTLDAERQAVNQQIGELESVLRSLKAPIERALLELRLSLLDSATEVAGSLRDSKDIIANSLGGFGPLAAIQRELADRFDTVVKELETGRLGGADDGRELDREDIQRRRALLQRLQEETQQLESTTRSAEALEQAFRRLADQLAETVRQEAAADVERTRRAANAAEARDGTGLDDFRQTAEREFAQGPQVEPQIDLEPLQARVETDLEAASTEANRVAAELQRRIDDDWQAIEQADRNLEDQTERLLGFNVQQKTEELGLGGGFSPASQIDMSLAARGQLQTRSVEDVRQAFLDAGADEQSVDEAIAKRLAYQEDEQKWWANRGASYEEQIRILKSGEAALDSAFSTDEEQQRFVAAYNELISKTNLGIDGAREQLSEITKQFTDRLSDEQLAELVPGQFTKQQIESSGGRLQAVIDDFQLETVENFRDSFSSLDFGIDGIDQAVRKQIADSLAPGQLTPGSIETIRSETGRRSRISDDTNDTMSAIRDFRRFDDTSTRGFVLEESSVKSLSEAGSRLRDSANALSSAESANERNQELAAEIESIRNAIDTFDGSLESRREIAEAADDSRFDEIANAADIFLQKVRDLDLERATTAFEEQIALEGQQRIEELDRQRQEFQRSSQEAFQDAARRGDDPAGIQDAVRQRDRLLEVDDRTAEQESQLAAANAAIATAFEQTAAGQQAARLADEIDIERQRQVQAREQRDAVRESASRGQDLLLRPEDVAARRGLSQFEDAQNAVLENLIGPLREVGGDGVAAELEDGILSLQELAQVFKRSPELREQLEGELEQSLANLRQARDNITGNVSAQIAQFDRERSRPSRQALQAQDINTQQGRAELNRLLRGDDANRDQPILQGIKEQTAMLKAIDDRIAEVNRVVSVAGD